MKEKDMLIQYTYPIMSLTPPIDWANNYGVIVYERTESHAIASGHIEIQAQGRQLADNPMTTMSLKSLAIFCSIGLMSYQYMIGRNTHSANNLTENEGQPLVPQFQPTKKTFFPLHKTAISVPNLSQKSNNYNSSTALMKATRQTIIRNPGIWSE